MLLRVITNSVAEGGNFRIIKWDLVSNSYVANNDINEYTFPVAEAPTDFPMNYHTYAVTPELSLLDLGETKDDKIITEENWDDSFDPMLVRVHDTFI